MKRKFIGFLLASVALFGILFACTSLNRLSETEFKDAIDKIDDKDGDTKELAIEIISPTNGQVITSSGFTVTGSAFSDEDVEQIFVILQPSDGDPNAVTASFSGDKIYSFSANFSAIAEGDYSLSAEVLDESGDSVSSSIISIVVALGGETNPITDISFSATPGLQEGEANAAPGETAGTLSVTGGEGTITYTLVSGTGDTHNNRFTIDGNAVKVGATALTEGVYNFRVKAECDISDYEKAFTVTVAEAEGGLADATLLIIFKNWSGGGTVYLPGDWNGWDPSGDSITVPAGATVTNTYENAVTSANLAGGDNPAEMELKVLNTAGNWDSAWGFGAWTLNNVTLSDGDKQIHVACTDNDVVIIEFDVDGANSITATVETR